MLQEMEFNEEIGGHSYFDIRQVLYINGHRLNANAKLVLFCVDSFGKDRAWPTQTQLSEYTGLSISSIRRAIRELERIGVLTTRQRHNSSLLYRVDRKLLRKEANKRRAELLLEKQEEFPCKAEQIGTRMCLCDRCQKQRD